MAIPKMTPEFLDAAEKLYASPEFRLRSTGDTVERRLSNLTLRDGHMHDGAYVLTVVSDGDTYDLTIRKRAE
jgi:hypothetical protein